MWFSTKYIFITVLIFSLLQTKIIFGQILFAEECFVGGVATCGMDYDVSNNKKCVIKWQDGYAIKEIYALTYRYGRPVPNTIKVNGSNLEWNTTNQAGPEQIETNPASQFFAPHAVNITNQVEIDNDTLVFSFPSQYNTIGNEGYWGVYLVILYEAPSITEKVCTRIYVANQSQVTAQNYNISHPNYLPDTPVMFALHASRLSGYEDDQTLIAINNEVLGEVNGPDLVPTPSGAGTQGHYYYENKVATGTNGDSATNYVSGQDAIAVINEYLNPEEDEQSFIFVRPGIIDSLGGGSNPHPSFNITYTPNCAVVNSEVNRAYETCVAQSNPQSNADQTLPFTLQSLPGYDHYAWTPAIGLSDTTLANPICTTDSSRWYRVSMWNDDGEVCSQTIPVFVTINPVPRPTEVAIKPATCPAQNGQIVVKNPAGKEPFTYFLNHVPQDNDTFSHLAPGSYDISVQSAAGCVWDTTVVIPLETVQHAAFTANPETGYSPLRVVFNNQSEHADSYTWLINNSPHSENKFMAYTFEEAGEYEVSLVAHGHEGACADTATVTIYVYQGLELILPNIITPNGDGKNDALVAQTAGIAHLRWEVYNRWGKVLHTGEANHPPAMLTLWSPEQGQYSSGTYTVILTAQGDSGEVKQMVQQVVVVGGPNRTPFGR